MRLSLLEKLVCPDCTTAFTIEIFEHGDKEIKDGVLICPRCNSFYFIDSYIPRILPPNLYFNKKFIDKYKDQIQSFNLSIEKKYCDDQDSLFELKKDTIKYFGYEWLEYKKFGWDDLIYNIKREESSFRRKSLLNPEDLQGKLVLDAGCGNGRYSFWAAEYGAEVFSIDLGGGVESAWENLRHLDNVHIIQADIFKLPFNNESFDIIFSIGVLMHTGNTKLATKSLVQYLKRNGSISIHVYHKGNPFYEINDFMIRKVTTRLSIKNLVYLTNVLYRLSKVLEKLRLLKITNLIFRLEPHPHCIFDWYSAPIATHHRYTEIYRWFDEFGLNMINNNKDFRPILDRYISSWAKNISYILFPPTALTVHGIKSK